MLSVSSAYNWHSIWLVAAAFIAGVLNAIAGGGSFLLFPAMLGTGILPVQANATNTVALWPGQVTAIAAFWQDVRKNSHLAVPMGLAGLVGGMAGALLLLNTPQVTFTHLIPWLLLIAATIFALSRPAARWVDQIRAARRSNPDAAPGPPRRPVLFLCTVLVCFYIGYFGAGAGLFIITMLSLFGFESLTEINALKVVSTTMANGTAFLIFVITGQVEWRYCLLAMLACAIGGYSSARFARRIPQPVLRGLVIALGFSMAAWYFYKTR